MTATLFDPSAKVSRPMNPPGWAYALTFVGGSMTLLPWLNAFKTKMGRMAFLAHAVLPWVLPWVVPINWLFVVVFWLVWNGVFGLLFLTLKPPLRQVGLHLPRITWLKRGIGAALAVLPMGCMLVALERWAADAIWSGLYPVNASLDTISFEVFALWQHFALLLLFTGVQAARTGESLTPARLLALLGFTFTGYFLINQAYMGMMAIPSWHLLEREVFSAGIEHGRELLYHMLNFIALPLISAAAYRSWLHRETLWSNWMRSLAGLLLALAGLSFASGMPIYYALLVGMEHEKAARPERAIPWYGKALTWSRSDQLNSYLQFHMGLLWRKQGRLDLAHEAFMRVLVSYPHDHELLVMAHEFRGRLENITDSTRRVIPGIEARTEYKNAYCVPNSLGLVLNYWGDRTGAKKIGAEITQLDQGSFITDAVHFAERRGFKSLVLPMRELEDVFKLIDHGFPVLTFIPGHVLAVFGYDRALQTLVTYDVNTVDIWDDQRWSVFQREWSQDYNTLAVVVPEAKLGEVRGLLGDDAEAKSEAYIQYLLGSLSDDIDEKARYLERASGHHLFFATWEREALLEKSLYSAAEDSAARDFLWRHRLPESQRLGYLRSLYATGHCREALVFLNRLKAENTLEQSMQLVRAGCLARTGLADSAVGVLLDETETASLPAPLLRFLLRELVATGETETAYDMALQALDQEDGVDGETAGLAISQVLARENSDPSEHEAMVDRLEAYLTRQNGYDTTALAALQRLAPAKRFNPEDELQRDAFLKRLELWRQRHLSLRR
jgi:hypothetical protein